MFSILADLMKVRITVFVAVTAMSGYILQTGRITWDMMVPALGIFLIACGSAALNQYQERETDAGMPRTQNRPIPTGAIHPTTALQIVVLNLLAGSLLILWGSQPETGVWALGLALFSVFWYNGVYLYLKRRSAFAVVPGSLLGAIPPMIGWTAAGGNPFALKIMVVAAFFFIWQIPHFWLLLLKYGKEYEGVGYPALTTVFSVEQIGRLIFIWVVAMAVIGVFVPFFAGLHPMLIRGGFVVIGLAMVWRTRKLLRIHGQATPWFTKVFIDINTYALLVTILLSIGAVLN